MNIKNNISTLTQDLFQPLKSNNTAEMVSKIRNHATSAYELDISASGMKSIEMFKDENIAIFNSDALTYTKDLRIIEKTI